MRIRSIKPGFCTSDVVADLPDDTTRLHSILLWMYADDHGRAIDNARLIKAALYPLDDSKTVADVERLQQALADHGRITRYANGPKSYFQVENWPEHQKPQHPKESEYPAPHEADSKPHEASPKRKLGDGDGVGDVDGEGAASQAEAELFKKFWNTYPKRNGKKLGKDKTATAFQRLNTQERADVMVAVVHYRKACDEKQTLAKDPFRWLSKTDKSWSDWMTPASSSDPNQAPAPYRNRPPCPNPECSNGWVPTDDGAVPCKSCNPKEEVA